MKRNLQTSLFVDLSNVFIVIGFAAITDRHLFVLRQLPSEILVITLFIINVLINILIITNH